MKRVFLSAFAAALALGTSAFTNVESKKQAVTFYHYGNNYVTSPPDGTLCKTDDNRACTLIYTSGAPTQSFPETAIPGSPTQSTQKGSYQP